LTPGELAVSAGHQVRVMAAIMRDAYMRPHPRAGDGPLVTAIIAAYNRAEVLRYALASAMAQTYPHLEILVVGDACTDDSERVVTTAAATDDRVRWHNLETNFGSQAGPNQVGLEMARGELIAYLGQDDLWRRDHVAVVVADLLRTGADVTSSVVSQVWPRPTPTRRFISPAAGGFVPTPSLMHTRAAGEAAGGWRDHRETVGGPDFDFYRRLAQQGRFSRVRALTVIKFASAQRPGSYRDRDDSEQAAAARRIDSRSFVAREVLTGLALSPLRLPFGAYPQIDPAQRAKPGGLIEEYRRIRGLDPDPRRDGADAGHDRAAAISSPSDRS
jgi:glycosyltransferase involved in cell wall biosynthesis